MTCFKQVPRGKAKAKVEDTSREEEIQLIPVLCRGSVRVKVNNFNQWICFSEFCQNRIQMCPNCFRSMLQFRGNGYKGPIACQWIHHTSVKGDLLLTAAKTEFPKSICSSSFRKNPRVSPLLHQPDCFEIAVLSELMRNIEAVTGKSVDFCNKQFFQFTDCATMNFLDSLSCLHLSLRFIWLCFSYPFWPDCHCIWSMTSFQKIYCLIFAVFTYSLHTVFPCNIANYLWQ